MPLVQFRSTDTGAPVLSGQNGKMTDLLDACLVNGLATLAISGITRSGSTATATLSSSNATLRTGDYVIFAGATQTDYNVTAQITVVDGTHVTYAVANSPTTPATTGSAFSYAKAGAGWAIAFTGTNKRVYRSANGASDRHYFRVLDDGTIFARDAQVRGFESMSDVDTGTNGFPTTVQKTNGVFFIKSSTADATARAWTLIADDKTCYLFVDSGLSANYIQPMGFGHFNSYKAGDAYRSFVSGNGTGNVSTLNTLVQADKAGLNSGVLTGATAASTSSLYCPRQFNQTGTSVVLQACDFRGLAGSNTGIGQGSATGIVYPNGPDSGLWIEPVYLIDFTGATFNVRGRLPGVYAHQHTTLPQTQYDTLTGVAGLAGLTLLAVNASVGQTSGTPVNGQLNIDITGPW